MSLLTSNLFGFNFVIHFTLITRPTFQLFPDIHFDHLLYFSPDYSSAADLEKPFSNAHSHDEHLCQVSFKFLQLQNDLNDKRKKISHIYYE